MGSDVPWVTWDPDFWEAEDVDAFSACVFDYFDGFVDGPLEV